jgi:DNA-binding transcriptional MerR regulator
VTYITIGEFAGRTRLSPKALRLYGELGLVVPARVDPDSGYRLYREDQAEQARLVALLRRLDMPLAVIAEVLPLDGPDAAGAVADWWAGVEAATDERRGLVDYLQARLRGEDHPMYGIELRTIPERTVLSSTATSTWPAPSASSRRRSHRCARQGPASRESSGRRSWSSTARSARTATVRWSCAGRWPVPGRAAISRATSSVASSRRTRRPTSASR